MSGKNALRIAAIATTAVIATGTGTAAASAAPALTQVPGLHQADLFGEAGQAFFDMFINTIPSFIPTLGASDTFTILNYLMGPKNIFNGGVHL